MFRSKVSLIVVMALIVPVLLIAGCGGEKKAMVTVNGEEVSKGQFRVRLENIPVRSPQGGTTPAGKYLVQQIINEKLMRQLAEKEEVAITKEDVDKEIKKIRKSAGGKLKPEAIPGLRRQIELRKTQTNLITKGIKITDEQVREVYDEASKRDPNPFERPEQVYVSVIAANSKDKIDKAYRLLEKGTEFGTVAMQLSDDPVIQKNQGKVAWIAREQPEIPENIRETAFRLEDRKYSKPFAIVDDNANSWVIVKRDRYRPAEVTKFENVKETLREQMALSEGSRKSDLPDRYAKFMKEAKISISVERYKDVSKEMIKGAKEALKQRAEELAKPAKPATEDSVGVGAGG